LRETEIREKPAKRKAGDVDDALPLGPDLRVALLGPRNEAPNRGIRLQVRESKAEFLECAVFDSAANLI
jgi:hypothetical protein